MKERNNTVEDLQEIVDKVFPPFQGDIRVALTEIVNAVETDNATAAFAFCADFKPCSPQTTEDDWMNLDRALAIPEVAQEFPELVDALAAHYSVTLSLTEIRELISSVIATTSFILRDIFHAEDIIEKCVGHYKGHLPHDVHKYLEHELCAEALRHCDRILQ